MMISIIIPTYSPGEYLFECLKSIGDQTLDKEMFDVLIVLNGPKDPYFTLISDYIAKSEITISLYYSDEKGVSNARNMALENVHSDYITFIDDDDLISPVYLQRLLEYAHENSIVVSNFQAFDGELSNLQPDYLSDAYNKLRTYRRLTILNSRKFFSNVCGKLIPVALIGNVRFDKRINIGEDSVFIVEISKNVSSIRLAAQDSIYYRRMRPESASRRKIAPKELIGLTIYQIGKYISMGFRAPTKYSITLLILKIIASVKSTVITIASNYR